MAITKKGRESSELGLDSERGMVLVTLKTLPPYPLTLAEGSWTAGEGQDGWGGAGQQPEATASAVPAAGTSCLN